MENCYIWETGKLLKNRHSDHRGYITNHIVSVSTGNHFNLPGHIMAIVKITILDKFKKNYNMYRKEQEKYFTNKFHTFHEGINRKNWALRIGLCIIFYNLWIYNLININKVNLGSQGKFTESYSMNMI